MTDPRGDAIEDALVSLHHLAEVLASKRKAFEKADDDDCTLELMRCSLNIANAKAKESEDAADRAAANLRECEARLAMFNAAAANATMRMSAQLVADYPFLANDFQLSFDASRLIRDVECAKTAHEAAVIIQDADYDDAERIETAHEMAMDVASERRKRFKCVRDAVPAAGDLTAVLDLIERLSRS